jgi:hypothetical protein
MKQAYDREADSVGNIVALEHVNVQVPDQRLSGLFYVSGLGLTRDPYMMVGDDNMWVNVGRSQFHLPTGQPQRVRGHVGIVLSDREALLKRLKMVKQKLSDTSFAVRETNDYVETISPWGNTIRCYEPDEGRFGRITLGMPYVEFEVPAGTAKKIARFYTEIMDAPATCTEDGGAPVARVKVGANQELLYRETDRKDAEPYDQHHIQIYVADFAAPYKRLAERGLVSREDSRYQYRFQDIVDVKTGKVLYTVEHEVRSTSHPMYNRPLVNRNPAQTAMTYSPGHDAWVPTMPPAAY